MGFSAEAEKLPGRSADPWPPPKVSRPWAAAPLVRKSQYRRPPGAQVPVRARVPVNERVPVTLVDAQVPVYNSFLWWGDVART